MFMFIPMRSTWRSKFSVSSTACSIGSTEGTSVGLMSMMSYSLACRPVAGESAINSQRTGRWAGSPQ